MRPLTASRAALLVLAALALAACEDNGGTMVNGKLCPDFKAPAPGAPAVAADAASPVDECVRRWAFSLAGSRDEAEVVANAAVAACGAAITRWNQASLNQPVTDPTTGAPTQTLSLDTGQPTNALAEHNSFAQRQALLYVIEARAGHCRPPPFVKGAPVGA
ncbi:MAG TPA: hypothetical protein VKQ54_03045 [Caulobacteraceae bacterium]|nr:hypothetical protein [Caulobacteraceae bacterium]